MAEKPYRVEAAPSARSTCTVSKAKIEKGELRLGSYVSFGGKGSYKWRRLPCITVKQAANIEKELGGPEFVDGFADLTAEQQDAFVAAFKTAGEAPPAPPAAADAAEGKDAAEEDGLPPAKRAKTEAAPKAKAKAKAKGKAKAKAASSSSLPDPSESGAAAAAGAIAVTPEVTGLAHAAIDLAKAGTWDSLYKALEAKPGLVNVRPDVREFSVLHQAAFHGRLDVVQTLIETYGADPDIRTKFGKSTVDVAREHGHGPVADFVALRLAGPSPGTKAGLGVDFTPEKVQKEEKQACWPGKSSTETAAKPACDAAAQSALTSTDIHTAHRAIDLAKTGKWEDLFTLLDFRKDIVNVRPDVRDYAVLHQAAFHGDHDVVDTLLKKYGADPAQQTKSGKTAAEVAREHGHAKVADAIDKYHKLGSVPTAMPTQDVPMEAAEDDDDDMKMVQMPDGTWKVVAAASAAPAPVASSSAKSAPCPPQDDDDDMKMVQMPDGTWKVVAAASAAPAPVSSSAAMSAPCPPQKAAASSSSSSSAGAGIASGSAPAEAVAVDTHFPEAAACRVHCADGVAWSCALERKGLGGSGQCVLQLLEDGAGGFCAWARWGSADVQKRASRFSSLQEARAAFEAQFAEKTGNRWQDRGAFRPKFGKYVLSKSEGCSGAAAPPVAAPAGASPAPPVAAPMAVPAMTPDLMTAAHKAIDMAKAARWGDLFGLLDKQPGLVNVRPEVREFSALHQAAYHGDKEVVATLINKYGADPAQKTKLGVSAAVVALGQGNSQVADFISARLPA